ncbi:nickel-dependent lactate racemase [Desulfosporosinus sp.]|uniref:nickel-dependent lactate racemase n=1 Tax=Desulfosporosinus sp. TaxID=157907 RepID=UPI002318E839|nr:nickel-dependent lactate racemase [Desulfosporosinus sp.]MCO5384790.1 nickel-dependent lactate racemase [Desulfosporosinus sp.]MDA8220149.1 nickel-dependent lactate racemase [Desulfitobacterium hafniense]
MNRFEVAYGKETLSFLLPSSVNAMEIEAKASQPILDIEQAILQAVAHPLGTAPLIEVVKPGDKVVIVVSDHTRLWVRTDVLLPVLLDVLNMAGIPDKDISLVTATGDHRLLTLEEHTAICGAKVLERVPIFDHECQSQDLVDLGLSTQGTPIKINRRVWEADKIILTGGIAYHLLAGFGGGRKSIAPGVCGYEMIQKNHALALKEAGPSGLNPNIQTGKMEGNPVAEDMLEIARLVGVDFILNVVVNEKKEFVYIAAGELHQAHLAGCRVTEEIFGIEIKEKADLVIVSSGGYPKDIQLYQSIKALDNATYAVKEGGIIILVSECSDGIGSQPFQDYFKYGEVEDMSARLHADFTMPGFVSLRTASICRKTPVILISSLPEDVVKLVKMVPAHSPAEALQLATQMLGHQPKSIYVMPHGGNTFPILS